MKTCDYCGGENEQTTSYCGGCGTAFRLDDEQGSWPHPLFRRFWHTKRKLRLMVTTAVFTSIVWGLLWRGFPKASPARSPSPLTSFDGKRVQLEDENAPSVRFDGIRSVTLRYDDSGSEPEIKAAVNGVTGTFIIDTGASYPLLSETGVHLFNLPLSTTVAPSDVIAFPFSGPAEARVATNVTVELAPGLTVHWPRVIVEMTNHPWVGLLDYGTLKALNAVMDLNSKTILVSLTPPNPQQ
jgi:hypothetical protein